MPPARSPATRPVPESGESGKRRSIAWLGPAAGGGLPGTNICSRYHRILNRFLTRGDGAKAWA